MGRKFMPAKFPGFKKCMAMMRNRDPQIQEDGFGWLSAQGNDYVRELIEEFHREENPGLRRWLLELIAAAGSPETFDLLTHQMRSEDPSLRHWAIRGLRNIDTKEARTLLWQARSFTFGTSEDTAAFRSDLDAVLSE